MNNIAVRRDCKFSCCSQLSYCFLKKFSRLADFFLLYISPSSKEDKYINSYLYILLLSLLSFVKLFRFYSSLYSFVCFVVLFCVVCFDYNLYKVRIVQIVHVCHFFVFLALSFVGIMCSCWVIHSLHNSSSFRVELHELNLRVWKRFKLLILYSSFCRYVILQKPCGSA